MTLNSIPSTTDGTSPEFQIPIVSPAIEATPERGNASTDKAQIECSKETNYGREEPDHYLSPQLQLLLLSFLALFLELMFIRWVPSTVLLVSYFSNLMLISSFLGLGLGAMVSSRGFGLFRKFPYALAFGIFFFFSFRNTAVGSGTDEMKFFAGSTELFSYLVLIGVFFSNAMIFMPIGEKIGQLFNRIPVLPAYSWDLGGSLLGTICFGLFSFFAFSPLLGIVAAMAIYLIVAGRGLLKSALVPFAVAVVLLGLTLEPNAIWSPYYFITVHKNGNDTPLDISTVPDDIATRMDPPLFTARVNHHFYQPHTTIDPQRFRAESDAAKKAIKLRTNYTIPYQFKEDPQRVAIVGAGGGVDVEAALLSSNAQIDAIEIDPKLVELNRRISPNGTYHHPRVQVQVNDARAFLQQSDEQYDLIVFGFLDSQALFSSFSSIRLDGYVYTVESLRAAFSCLDDDGVISLSFFVGDQTWLSHKLCTMVEKAVGEEPLVYFDGSQITLIAQKNPIQNPPKTLNQFELQSPSEESLAWAGSVPTDDWPYLYLKERKVPTDYLIIISTMLAFSIGSVFVLRSGQTKSFRSSCQLMRDIHFFFLGVAFLLLQTNSITQCSLYFGATWIVTTVIVGGVLVMVLLANLAAIRFVRSYTPWLYAPLFVSLAAVCFTPTSMILELPFVGRLMWVLFVVPLPIFFAGLVFSTTFRTAESPSSSLGANLIGATTGGFIEYAGMAFGHHALFYVVIAAYAASLSVMLVLHRQQLRENS